MAFPQGFEIPRVSNNEPIRQKDRIDLLLKYRNDLTQQFFIAAANTTVDHADALGGLNLLERTLILATPIENSQTYHHKAVEFLELEMKILQELVDREGYSVLLDDDTFNGRACHALKNSSRYRGLKADLLNRRLATARITLAHKTLQTLPSGFIPDEPVQQIRSYQTSLLTPSTPSSAFTRHEEAAPEPTLAPAPEVAPAAYATSPLTPTTPFSAFTRHDEAAPAPALAPAPEVVPAPEVAPALELAGVPESLNAENPFAASPPSDELLRHIAAPKSPSPAIEASSTNRSFTAPADSMHASGTSVHQQVISQDANSPTYVDNGSPHDHQSNSPTFRSPSEANFEFPGALPGSFSARSSLEIDPVSAALTLFENGKRPAVSDDHEDREDTKRVRI